MSLTGKQRKKLRGLAHALSPAVHVGRQGVTEAVLGEVERALDDHELIKIKLQTDRDERQRWLQQVVEHTGAEVVGTIGGVGVLYRAHPDPESRRVDVG